MAEGIGDLDELAVYAGIVRDACIGKVVEAVFGANGAGCRAIPFEARADGEGEVRGAGIGNGDRPGGKHVASQDGEDGLNAMAREKVQFEAERREAFAEGPLALAGDGVGFGVGDSLVHAAEGS